MQRKTGIANVTGVGCALHRTHMLRLGYQAADGVLDWRLP